MIRKGDIPPRRQARGRISDSQLLEEFFDNPGGNLLCIGADLRIRHLVDSEKILVVFEFMISRKVM